MGILGDNCCVECGSRTNILTRIDLKDGKKLCGKCAKILPSYLRRYADSEYTYEDYLHAKKWLAESIEKYADIYKETFSYGPIGIDEEHGLLAPDYYTRGKTPIIRIDDLIEYHFLFTPEVKEGLLGYKAKGDVKIVITVANPPLCFETCLEYGASVNADKKIFRNEFEYKNPRKMVEMEQVLERTRVKFPTSQKTIDGFQHNRYYMFLGR